jgi:hypothetical protein
LFSSTQSLEVVDGHPDGGKIPDLAGISTRCIFSLNSALIAAQISARRWLVLDRYLLLALAALAI